MGHSISFLEIEKRTNEYAAKEVTKEINEEGSFQAMHIMCEVAKATRKIRLAVLRREKCVEIPTFEVDRAGLLKLKRIRQRNYTVDKGGGVDYRRAAAQAAGVSPASR